RCGPATPTGRRSRATPRSVAPTASPSSMAMTIGSRGTRSRTAGRVSTCGGTTTRNSWPPSMAGPRSRTRPATPSTRTGSPAVTRPSTSTATRRRGSWGTTSSGPGRRPASRAGRKGARPLRGRRYILVDEWRPVDPRVPRLFPAEQSAAGSAALSVLGVGVPWRVASLTEGFVADPTAGKAPATFRVRRAPDAKGPSLAPFEVTVHVGAKDLSAKGSLLAARWRVSFFAWTKDPREDAAAWNAPVAGVPLGPP